MAEDPKTDRKRISLDQPHEIHRVRELLGHQRTALINQVRGLLGKRGLTIARSPQAFKRAIPSLLAQAEAELTKFCHSLVIELVEQIGVVEERIGKADTWIDEFMARSTLYKRVAAVKGSVRSRPPRSSPRLARPGSSRTVATSLPGSAWFPGNTVQAASRA